MKILDHLRRCTTAAPSAIRQLPALFLPTER
jgi:hypothetical protein